VQDHGCGKYDKRSRFDPITLDTRITSPVLGEMPGAVLEDRPARRSFTLGLKLFDRVKTVLARFTAIGLDVSREQDVIHDVRP
jgi:hypothetical protein